MTKNLSDDENDFSETKNEETYPNSYSIFAYGWSEPGQNLELTSIPPVPLYELVSAPRVTEPYSVCGR